MNLLAIETSTDACSVALFSHDQAMQDFKIAPRQHNQLLLGMIDQLLKQSQLQIQNLNAIAYSQGPGSFTGIRFAASITQGLALAHDLPVIPISTLQVQAQSANRLCQQTKIMVCNDARMQAVYWASFQLDELNIMTPMTKEHCTAITELSLPDEDTWFAVGDGWDVYSQDLSTMVAHQIHKAQEKIYPQAIDMLAIAQLKFEKGEYVSGEEALPVYLREIQYKQTG